jgi:hypothetical protein
VESGVGGGSLAEAERAVQHLAANQSTAGGG